jgi:hypothetical protein
MKPPAFYDKMAADHDELLMRPLADRYQHVDVKARRQERAAAKAHDETPERRAVRAKVRDLLGAQFERMD